jgi:hypothetical protein
MLPIIVGARPPLCARALWPVPGDAAALVESGAASLLVGFVRRQREQSHAHTQRADGSVEVQPKLLAQDQSVPASERPLAPRAEELKAIQPLTSPARTANARY